MPCYDYLCSDCGHGDIEFQRMADRHLTLCPKCNKETYLRQVSLPHTDMKDFHTPVEMLSIAMEDPEQIKRFLKECPEVTVSLDENDPNFGVPIAKSRKAKLQALKAAKFMEVT